MITVDQLLDIVMKKVNNDDSHINADNIIIFFNNCAVKLATEVGIRQLATVADVTVLANENTVSLPTNYCCKLKKAFNKSTKYNIKVYPSRIILDKNLGVQDRSGTITHIAEDGDCIFCRDTSSSNQILTIYYHRMPDEIIEGGNFPNWIKQNFVYELFYHFAVAACYDIIEDGIEGEKVNTIYHEDRFNTAMEKFKIFIGPDPDYPFVPDMTSEFEDW